MIYELRIYRCVPGRKPALLSRFENETLRIWEKHGIRQVGFWTTLIGKSSQEITYMLAWDSMRSEEHTSELQSQSNLVCRLLLEKKKKKCMIIKNAIK